MAVPPTVPESFRKAVRFLEENRVPFVVVGGIAVGFPGRLEALLAGGPLPPANPDPG